MEGKTNVSIGACFREIEIRTIAKVADELSVLGMIGFIKASQNETFELLKLNNSLY